MSRYLIRRLLVTIPTLLLISFVLFSILALAPNDPTSNLPLSIPPEVRANIRESMGLDQPFLGRYLKWLDQFFINEPLNLVEKISGMSIGNSNQRFRTLSWMTRGPVVDLIVERLPQTVIVVGLSYLLSILIAIPVGVLAAYKRRSWFDFIASILAVIAYSIPNFFTGLLLILIFTVGLNWLPSIYDTNLKIQDATSFWQQIKQMIMPVTVLALSGAAELSRYTRSAVLDNLSQDYVRTARGKGLEEQWVLIRHVLRNSLIPVITLIAMTIPKIFTGAIVTEQIFRVNGIGQLLIVGIQGGDLPLVQTIAFVYAILIVLFNIVADACYAVLDPRIRFK